MQRLHKAILAAPLLASAAFACNAADEAGKPPRELNVTASNLVSLFEQECVRWGSFHEATVEYARKRDVCMGAITKASIGDCQSNVVDVDWPIRATNGSVDLRLSYFFDEVEKPDKNGSLCEIALPPRFAVEGSKAAREIAAKFRLKGPFRPDERLFWRPTLLEYWINARNVPTLGVYSTLGPHKGTLSKDFDQKFTLARFPASTPAIPR